jgi:hypothetical protein
MAKPNKNNENEDLEGIETKRELLPKFQELPRSAMLLLRRLQT